MTSPPPPQPEPGRPVLPVLRPLRDLTAYAFVAAPAVWLFVAIIRLIPSGVGQDFLTRVQNSFYSYVNVEIVLLPLAAVLLSTLIEPRHRQARLITLVALIEYAVAGAFAVLFGFLIGIVKIAGFSIRVAFEELLVRAAWLAVFAVAAYAVFAIWRSLYTTPRPKPQPPGTYGQPQWGQQPYGQPGYPQPGQPQPGQPGFPPGQPGFPPGYPQPGQPHPGQHQSQPWGMPQPQQPPAPPASAPPASEPPSYGPPASPPQASPPQAFAPPASAPPAPGTPPGPYAPAPGNPHAPGTAPSYGPPPGGPAAHGGPADPTQAIPARTEDDDSTRVLREEPPKA
ncbi:hypothetical protein Asp14428_35940 [Actinoplanes sp. NBRC 14428]|nr:hypothetical protein Asp14428_35940 [Actinoplanes sp. NBRC 14428]